MGVALRLLADSAPLVAALERFGPLYMDAVSRRWLWRLGVAPKGSDDDAQLVALCEQDMRAREIGPDAFFFAHRGGRGAGTGELGALLASYTPADASHDYWSDAAPQSLLIDEVEAIWAAIAEHDDWQPLQTKIASLRRMGAAHGVATEPQGHSEGVG